MKTIKYPFVNKDKYISVVKDNQNLIYKICSSYCSNSEDRKDLQQEILLQIWNSFTKFDGRVKISTWIYRIALNTAISFYRKDRKHKEWTINENSSITLQNVFEAEYEDDEDILLLHKYIECLNELDKALIILYLDKNSYKEMSEILGISESNVATKISRIKQKLKEQFKNN